MSDYTIELKGDDISKWQLAKEAVKEIVAKIDDLLRDETCEAGYTQLSRFRSMIHDTDAFEVLRAKDEILEGLDRIAGQSRTIRVLMELGLTPVPEAGDECLPPIPDEIQVEEQVHEQRVEALREQVKPAKVKTKAYKPSKPKLGKIIDTPNPTLTRAVIKQVGGKDALIDVYNHGAMGGFCGFTYYNDTVPFFEKHRAAILEFLEESAEECGEEPVQMVMGFNCLRLSDADREEQRTYRGAINRLLYSGRKVDWKRNEEVQVANALAWYALEEVARDMVDVM